MGAAIAAGNHLEKGICALLVIAANRMRSPIIKSNSEDQK